MSDFSDRRVASAIRTEVPRLRGSLHESLERTIAWYRSWDHGEDMAEISARQIAEYVGASQV